MGTGGSGAFASLIRDSGAARVEHVHFGILEVADSNAGADDILPREQHWQAPLHTRKYGYDDH